MPPINCIVGAALSPCGAIRHNDDIERSGSPLSVLAFDAVHNCILGFLLCNGFLQRSSAALRGLFRAFGLRGFLGALLWLRRFHGGRSWLLNRLRLHGLRGRRLRLFGFLNVLLRLRRLYGVRSRLLNRLRLRCLRGRRFGGLGFLDVLLRLRRFHGSRSGLLGLLRLHCLFRRRFGRLGFLGVFCFGASAVTGAGAS